jgi:hypothetical protein
MRAVLFSPIRLIFQIVRTQKFQPKFCTEFSRLSWALHVRASHPHCLIALTALRHFLILLLCLYLVHIFSFAFFSSILLLSLYVLRYGRKIKFHIDIIQHIKLQKCGLRIRVSLCFRMNAQRLPQARPRWTYMTSSGMERKKTSLFT